MSSFRREFGATGYLGDPAERFGSDRGERRGRDARNRTHDIPIKIPIKRAIYGRAGVREYWMADPEARPIEILSLDRDALPLVAAASGSETPVSPLLGSLPITAADILAGIED